LPVAFAPETAKVVFDGFVNLVAGEIRLDGEHTEDDVGSSGVLHISLRYICQIIMSTGFLKNLAQSWQISKKAAGTWPAAFCKSEWKE
jgi:hypothetical protein